MLDIVSKSMSSMIVMRQISLTRNESFSSYNLVESFHAAVGSTTTPDEITQAPIVPKNICLTILYRTIGGSQVGIWDLMLLIPNVIFMAFLLFKLRKAFTLLTGQNSSPIFLVIFALISTSVFISIVRCVVSMVIASTGSLNVVDRVMWLIHRFFLLASELSVVTFGLLFVHLDSRTSLRKIIIVAFSLSLIYSVCQGALEFVYADKMFHTDEFTLFGHGGLLFWFSSSLCLFLIYATICILPYTPLAQRITLPGKRSFYVYCLILSVLDVTQAAASLVLYLGEINSLCVIDVTAYLYFTCFAPFVYVIYLHSFLRNDGTEVPFSYQPQADEEDDASLPHQALLYEQSDVNSYYDDINDSIESTHFSCNAPLLSDYTNRPDVTINPDLLMNISTTGNYKA